MTLKLEYNTFFIFDLDDTLFSEIEFLKSGYQQIADHLSKSIGTNIYPEMWRRYMNHENVFAWIIKQFGDQVPGLTPELLLDQYRRHLPEIKLPVETEEFLLKLKNANVPMGLISDGRSITQRNKLKALGIESWFSDIIISEEFGSEKPDSRNFLYFQEKYPGNSFIFIGDNTIKDFIIPVQLGWKTICLKDRGNNIHSQEFEQESVADFIVSSFAEIEIN
jgi:putative hydrolase of the HAD superfamily